MNEWLYTLRGRLTPQSEKWHSYLSLSGFVDVIELVTLDMLLCPDLVEQLRDEDWDYNVHADNQTNLFRDSNYLMRRQPLDASRHQVLGFVHSPNGSEVVPNGFTQCGFDIIDSYGSISALTNCGPLPQAFTSTDVNQFGLLPDLEGANRVRDCLRQFWPDDPHLGRCETRLVARRLPRA